MATRLMAAMSTAGFMSTAGLKESRFNLASHHDEIVVALDMLFQGF